MKKLAFLFIFLISISACTTTKSVVSSSANLERYNYATITDVMNYGGSAILMGLEVKIYDGLYATRLQVIGDKQLQSLSESQKKELLLVRFSASQSEDESVVSINFVDYTTGVPIASCIGAHSLGWTKKDDMKSAIDKAVGQMKKLFPHDSF